MRWLILLSAELGHKFFHPLFYIIMSNKKIQKEVDRMILKIKRDYKPEKIFIFGSYARGKMTLNSDVDFFIIKKTDKPRIERQREVSRLLIDREVPIDILVFTPKEAEKRKKMGDGFILDIIKTGKLVYAKR